MTLDQLLGGLFVDLGLSALGGAADSTTCPSLCPLNFGCNTLVCAGRVSCGGSACGVPSHACIDGACTNGSGGDAMVSVCAVGDCSHLSRGQAD